MIELNKKNIIKLLFIIGVAIVFYWMLQNLSIFGDIISFIFKLLAPFIIGLCVAFILNIPIRFIEKNIIKFKNNNYAKKKKKTNTKNLKRVSTYTRIITILLSIILIIGILFFVMFLVVPEIINTFDIFKNNFPNMINDIKIWIQDMMHNYPQIVNKINSISIDWNSVYQSMSDTLKDGFTDILSSSFSFVASIFTSIVNFVIGFIFAIYILAQKEKLLTQLKKILYAYVKKEKADKICDFCKITNDTFSSFLGSQFLEACILGILCFVGMVIFKFPYALTVSVLVGVTALIPVFGAFIGVAVGAVLILVINPTQAFWFVIYFIILQQIEGNLIYPKVVGNSVGLPAMWVMVAVTIGCTAMGVFGMIIVVPIATVAYKYLRKDVNKNLKSKRIDI